MFYYFIIIVNIKSRIFLQQTQLYSGELWLRFLYQLQVCASSQEILGPLCYRRLLMVDSLNHVIAAVSHIEQVRASSQEILGPLFPERYRRLLMLESLNHVIAAVSRL